MYQIVKLKKAVIDSLNVANKSFEYLFSSDNYNIELVKGLGTFVPERWMQEFGKMTTQSIVEAKILHTNKGLTIPLKRFNRSPQMQTIEFAGLYGYNEISMFRRELLKEFLTYSDVEFCFVKRMDIAIDFTTRIPARIKKKIISQGRMVDEENKFNTEYYKTKSEKKTNSTMDIKIYDKEIQAKLSHTLYRLEFCFKGAYFNNMQLKDINLIYKKIKKSILKFTGLNVPITPLFTL